MLALAVLLKILSLCVSQVIHYRDKMRIFLEIHQTLCLWELQHCWMQKNGFVSKSNSFHTRYRHLVSVII